jgi:hypothetical protein
MLLAGRFVRRGFGRRNRFGGLSVKSFVVSLSNHERLKRFVSLPRRLFLMSGLGPTAEILSFAWPKESIQRKGHPMPLDSCAPKGLNGVFGRAIHSPPKTSGIPAAPLRAIPSKPSGARRGIKGQPLRAKKSCWLNLYFGF